MHNSFLIKEDLDLAAVLLAAREKQPSANMPSQLGYASGNDSAILALQKTSESPCFEGQEPKESPPPCLAAVDGTVIFLGEMMGKQAGSLSSSRTVLGSDYANLPVGDFIAGFSPHSQALSTQHNLSLQMDNIPGALSMSIDLFALMKQAMREEMYSICQPAALNVERSDSNPSSSPPSSPPEPRLRPGATKAAPKRPLDGKGARRQLWPQGLIKLPFSFLYRFSMPRRGDGSIALQFGERTIGQLSRDDSGASMIRGIAATTGNDPELSREKTAKKRRHTEAGEGPCLHASGGGHLESEVLAGISPAQTTSSVIESQPLLANLQAGDKSISPTLHVSPTDDARRLQMGNVLPLAGTPTLKTYTSL
ncbi:UNVERIFIED_CONTAM: hypothetical protein K2H54_051223 [Gekko kuhli]